MEKTFLLPLLTNTNVKFNKHSKLPPKLKFTILYHAMSAATRGKFMNIRYR